MYLVTSEQMQLFDRRTISTLCVPGIVLMEHAGKAVAEHAASRGPQHVVVVCGKGNNGGDGWVAARWLRHVGVSVEVVSLVPVSELTGDARLAAKMAERAGVPWRLLGEESNLAVDERPLTKLGTDTQPGTNSGEEWLPRADVYIDALLGTGSNRPVAPDSRYGRVIQTLNQSGAWVIAVDVPSGIDASTGCVGGVAVTAHETVSFAAEKLGTAISPGCQYAGRVHVVDIGIRLDADAEAGPLAEWVTEQNVARWLPDRPPSSHKGTYGRVAIALGAMQGAAVLAGLGAARGGCGLVALVGPHPPTLSVPPEFVVRSGVGDLLAAVSDCKALVLGPGLGQAVDVWRPLLSEFPGPVVLDADGLRLIQQAQAGLPSRTERSAEEEIAEIALANDAGPAPRAVLTPHPKECARLLGWSTADVQARRLEAATTLARRTGAVVVLKGYHSLIADPSGRLAVNPTGDASLATAGTGDVLAGLIGGLLAQGLAPFAAAAAGTWIHGRAGEMAGEAMGRASVMASDVIDNISRAIHLHFDK
ncbi:bifunctional ADP-dependent NAD(P)H-hydrate dehydratase/NAD(P)H-hydrate epimerase [Alicyclobacillus herbarius]|uniref:bifunctional ADP-dependent NAD(P)H-hydrate dehydratase/NAD(P)H-hydrate epimerase n=1 Tax=Alicyclobacillus herbarius TaxID=122960 RepID=UPI00042671A4|nr:bifunctional ADP-dependent NAD(P)H-hydrate dehydratase/NAD(P)H-hydrate epimerase [Alicyclobacillus herbarius]